MFIPRYPIHTDLSAEGELSQDATDLRQKGSWLRNALAMNVYNSKSAPLRKLVNFLFDEITNKTATKPKSHNKFKQTLKAIIINLWFCALMGMPIRYPRDKNAYSHDSKYGQLYFKYANTINAIDALMALGYIEQKKGRSRYEDKKKGYQTRMWATPQLVTLFMEYGLLSS